MFLSLRALADHVGSMQRFSVREMFDERYLPSPSCDNESAPLRGFGYSRPSTVVDSGGAARARPTTTTPIASTTMRRLAQRLLGGCANPAFIGDDEGDAESLPLAIVSNDRMRLIDH